jgi:hypothetical protein
LLPRSGEITQDLVKPAPVIEADLPAGVRPVRDFTREIDIGTAPKRCFGAPGFDQAEDEVDGLGRRAGKLPQLRFQNFLPAVTLALQVGGDQGVLGLEMGVERGLGDLGPGHNFIHPYRMESTLIEELVGGVENPGASRDVGRHLI